MPQDRRSWIREKGENYSGIEKKNWKQKNNSLKNQPVIILFFDFFDAVLGEIWYYDFKDCTKRRKKKPDKIVKITEE